MKTCDVARLGLIDYQSAWDLQKRLAAARAADRANDTLLLLEHPHIYTLGRTGQEENLLLDEAQRTARGVEVAWVDRGGDITYHGPGQLVGYPIMDLGQPQQDGRIPQADYVGYVRLIEAMLIRALETSGSVAYAEAGYTGVWVDGQSGPEKVGAIGVRVNAGGVSMHGFALNVSTDLSYFGDIIPCGIDDRAVTSLETLLGREVSMDEAMNAVEDAFAATFEVSLRSVTLDNLPA